MKLLAITNIYPSPERPWLGTFVEQQLKGLQSIGVEVKVLYFDRKKEGPLIYYRMGPRIAEAIAGFRPDLMHVMYGGVMADKITNRSWPVPVVVTFHGSDLLGENLSGFFRKIVSHYGVHCSRRAARRASGVVVVARHLLKALPFAPGSLSPNAQVSGLIPQPSNDRQPSTLNLQPSTPIVRIIPCGIDLERFKPMEQESCRQKLGWAPGTFHILFPANTGDPVKRPWLAKAAVQALKEQGVNAELHLLSGVPYADVPLWINASDVLILTSLHEGSPMVVKEALACDVSVVSVDVGDVKQRISGIDGCHIATSEPLDLASKLGLVNHRRGRVHGREHIKDLSLSGIAEKISGFYDELLGEFGGSRSHAKPALAMRSLRVLAVTNVYPTVSEPFRGTFIEQQIKGLRQKGLAIDVLHFERRAVGPSIYLRMKRDLTAYLRHHPVDLVHAMYGGMTAMVVARAVRQAPVIVSFCGSDLLGENLPGVVRGLMVRLGVRASHSACRKAAGIIVKSNNLLNALPAGLQLKHVRVIPNGIDIDRFKEFDQLECRKRLGWANNCAHVLFPANSGSPVKRPWLAKAAVELARSRGLDSELHFLQGVPHAEVPVWLNACDAIILTSKHEGSPNVVKEALACGSAIVSVDVGDVAERIEGIDGCYIAAANPKDLANKLILACRRGHRIDAKQQIADLSLERISDRVIGFYREVLADWSQPGSVH